MTDNVNFIKDFQKDHEQLLAFVNFFKDAVQVKNTAKAKQILEKIETIANTHFIFEETYLYPRIRRLVSQITEGLSASHQLMWDFIVKSQDLLKSNRMDKTDSLFENVKELSESFDSCNGLAYLADKFSEYDKNDSNERYKECCQLTHSPDTVKM